MVKTLRVGISLQIIFFVLFFSTILAKMNNVMGALICLFIGFLSLAIGIKSVKSSSNKFLPSITILISIAILGFTIFAYFMGEGGQPPLIMQ